MDTEGWEQFALNEVADADAEFFLQFAEDGDADEYEFDDGRETGVLEALVAEGREAANRVCEYVDWLATSMIQAADGETSAADPSKFTAYMYCLIICVSVLIFRVVNCFN